MHNSSTKIIAIIRIRSAKSDIFSSLRDQSHIKNNAKPQRIQGEVIQCTRYSLQCTNTALRALFREVVIVCALPRTRNEDPGARRTYLDRKGRIN